MEQEWISLNEFMRRNHIGYETALKLINSGKIEHQKIGGQYKIKVSKDKKINENMEKLIRENEELKTFVRTAKKFFEQIEVQKGDEKLMKRKLDKNKIYNFIGQATTKITGFLLLETSLYFVALYILENCITVYR